MMNTERNFGPMVNVSARRAARAGRIHAGAVLVAIFLAMPILLLCALTLALVLEQPGAATTARTSSSGTAQAATAQIASDSPASTKEAPMSTNPVVEIQTTLGTMKARLFLDKAPKTAQNFLDLVEQKYYDGIVFHRVIKDFMVQTGCPLGTGTGGRTDKGLPKKFLADEFHPTLKHDRPGLLSMANRGPNTGDTQIFITTVPTPWLDNKHAIFGEIIEGMDVLKKIEGTRTGANDRPVEPISMTSVRVVPATPATNKQ